MADPEPLPPGAVRGAPSLTEGRLHHGNDGVDRKGSNPSRGTSPGVAGGGAVPAGNPPSAGSCASSDDDSVSRHGGTAGGARRVHILNAGGGDDETGDAPLRLPGAADSAHHTYQATRSAPAIRPLSLNALSPSATDPHSLQTRSYSPHNSFTKAPRQASQTQSAGSAASLTSGWGSGRGNGATSLMLPPDTLPLLHRAAWDDDLTTLQDMLKQPLSELGYPLVWYNKKVYGSGGRHDGPAHPDSHTALLEPPTDANMKTARTALTALLSREYLRHACHPLTIAAAVGNARMIEELLNAIKRDHLNLKLEDELTWRDPPKLLPEGCPWVTPLAAAALSGSGECVRMLGAAMPRKFYNDRSTYGCFRFRPAVVAQTADAVQSLFAYNCCHERCISESMCIKVCIKVYRYSRKPRAREEQAQEAPSEMPSARCSDDGGITEAEDEARAGPDGLSSPPEGTTVTQRSETTRKSAMRSSASARKKPQQEPKLTPSKQSEVLLFRARLFHDRHGRPLQEALRNVTLDTLDSLEALTALLEQGLDPDLYLSHEEHVQWRSTSLLMLVVRNYRDALRSARRNPGVVANLSQARAQGTNATFRAPDGATSNGVGDWASSTDLEDATQDVLTSLVAALLASKAEVDKEPKSMAISKIGGIYLADSRGPEAAAIEHAFANGPQALVVQLLQYSRKTPDTFEDLYGEVAQQAGVRAATVSQVVGAGAASLPAVYQRTPKQVQAVVQQNRLKMPWEDGHHSALLAFGAKLQRSLVAGGGGSLPQWLVEGRFSELLVDLIKCTMAKDADRLVGDLSWLVTDVFERCMAHDFETLGTLYSASEHDADAVISKWNFLVKFAGRNKNKVHPESTKGEDAPALPPPPAEEPLPASTVITVEEPLVVHAAKARSGSATEAKTVGFAALDDSTVVKAKPDAERKRRSVRPRSAGSNDGSMTRKEEDSRLTSDEEEEGEGGSDEDDDDDDTDSQSSNSSDEGGKAAEASVVPMTSPDDSETLHTIYSLYRQTADTITDLHQAMKDGTLDGPLVSVSASFQDAQRRTRLTLSDSAPKVDWPALLRLVSRIAAITLNPPKEYGVGATQISVFVAAKAVNQLLYSRDWAPDHHVHADDAGDGGLAGGGGGGEVPGTTAHTTVVDIDLLRAVARRHPHEAARLLHGMDPIRVQLNAPRWDTVPMNLDQNFYTVVTRGEPLRINTHVPTVAPLSVATAAFEKAAAIAAEGKRRKPRSSAHMTQSAAQPRRGLMQMLLGALLAYVSGNAAAEGEDPDATLTQWDIVQACIFASMWRAMTHFMLSAVRLPKELAALERLRLRTYMLSLYGQCRQYGSIPVVIGMVALVAVIGIITRGVQGLLRLLGAGLVLLADKMGERLQPAMHDMGRRLGFQRGMKKLHRAVKKLDHLATGDKLGVGSTAHLVRRIIPRYLSFLGLLLNPDELDKVWLGVTRSAGRARQQQQQQQQELADSATMSAVSGRTTRVLCSRVPLPCAAGMPAVLLYRLASSPQVNGEVFACPTMKAVITWRWQHFARYFMLLQCMEHLIYMTFFMLYAFSLSYSTDAFTRVLGEARTLVNPRGGCKLPVTGFQQFLLISVGVLTVTCVMQEVRQILFFRLGWFQQPWNLLDFASSTIVGVILGLHFSCLASVELLRGLAAVEVALLFIRLLYFAMADDRLGSFFRMVIEVFRDLSLFFVFLGILFVGWGLALSVLQGQEVKMVDTYLQLFTMIFGDFSMETLQSANAGSEGLNHLYRIFVSLYQILVTIILLNLLIAIINDSYERISDNESYESLRNKLTLIVEAESVLPQSVARYMLETLARTDLYIITPEAATVGTTPDDCPQGMARRPLPPPARWTGRMGETKRFVHSVVDQLMAQQAHFESRMGAMWSTMKSPAGNEALRSGAGPLGGSMHGGMRDGGHGAGGGLTGSHQRQGGAGPLAHAPSNAAMQMGAGGDADALERMLETKLNDMVHRMVGQLADQNNRTLTYLARKVAADAAKAAVEAAAAATDAVAFGMGRRLASADFAPTGTMMDVTGRSVAASSTGGFMATVSASGETAADGEPVVLTRGELKAMVQEAAKEAAAAAVQQALAALGQQGGLGGAAQAPRVAKQPHE